MNESIRNQDNRNSERRKSRWVPIAVAGGVLLVVAGVLFFMNGGFVDQNDPKVVAEKVGKHILVDGEEPKVTTVENAEEMSAQPFFSNVKNGDKILIYMSAARIIVYRPSDDVLVNVGPIVDDNMNNASSGTDK